MKYLISSILIALVGHVSLAQPPESKGAQLRREGKLEVAIEVYKQDY
jgi:hypothetical protein